MGMITILALGFIGLLGAAFSKILAEEFKAWAPTIASYLVRLAVCRLPKDERDRYREEWSAHIQDTPGDIGKIASACGLIVAAIRIANPLFIHFACKRAFDLTIAGLALVVMLPLLFILAAALHIEDPGPVFVRKTRIGRGGRIIQIYRFRTKRINADLSTLPLGTPWDFHYTRIGRLLYLGALDELPMLFSVLKGDVSMIGPQVRAAESHAVATEGEYLDDRLKMRPGITSPSLVQSQDNWGRSAEAMRRRAEYDREYVNNYSFYLDIAILCMAVLKTWREIRISRRR